MRGGDGTTRTWTHDRIARCFQTQSESNPVSLHQTRPVPEGARQLPGQAGHLRMRVYWPVDPHLQVTSPGLPLMLQSLPESRPGTTGRGHPQPPGQLLQELAVLSQHPVLLPGGAHQVPGHQPSARHSRPTSPLVSQCPTDPDGRPPAPQRERARVTRWGCTASTGCRVRH